MRLFSPAKVNLLLAVTGKREDGFHNLISLVSPISFGDTLSVCLQGNSGELVLNCNDPEVPAGDANLVVKAAQAFRAATGLRSGLSIQLEKRIPMEAGLGGGSSNAATTLLILNRLFKEPLSFEALAGLAAGLGSDCPLFLHRKPVLMRGRGEQIELLPPAILADLTGRSVAVFNPGIGVSTAWAYAKLASKPELYACIETIESRLKAWREGTLPLEALLMNSFEEPVFEKFVALPALFGWIREEMGLSCLMSGSGSSCFALVEDSDQAGRLKMLVEKAWGRESLFEVCHLGLAGTEN